MDYQVESDERKKTILIVDDDPFVLESASLLLGRYGFTVLPFESAADALATLPHTDVDAVLTDIKMPGITGIELLEKLHIIQPELPVILMTAFAELDIAIHAVKNDAFDFLIKPYTPEYLVRSVEKAVKYTRLIQMEKNYKRLLEATVLKRTQELADALKIVTNMTQEIVQRLTGVAEFRDTDTGAHISRISLFAGKIAEALGMPQHYVEMIRSASPLHDIGKIGIPDNILLKAGPLTYDEFEIMKGHTLIGEKMLGGSLHPTIQMAASIALNHHERWDGSGYPNGLKGDAIPIEGRILIICDQYDALRSKRPYKTPFSHEDVYRILTVGDGRTMPGHFDPAVLAAFRDLAPIFDEIFSSHQD